MFTLRNPLKKVKGGGTKKVCLPAAKVRSMSKAERDKVVRATEAYELFFKTDGFDPSQFFLTKTL